MDLIEAIIGRRSTRNFTHHHVTDDEIRSVLEAARMAPSWANSQVWEFIVVRDRDLIKKVTGTYSETNPARKCSLASSAIIVACAKLGVSGCKGGRQRTKFSEWFMFDLGMAVQNLCLRAHELGLGTVVVGSMDHESCRLLLGVPDGYEVVAAIPIGRPATSNRPPARKELSSFIHRDTFGSRDSTPVQ